MPLFIVRPKTGVRAGGISLAGRKLTPEARGTQTAEVADLNLTDSTQNEIAGWITKHKSVKEISQDAVKALGLHVVQMSPEQAEKIEKELPQAEAIPDRPLDLITPANTPEKKDDPSEPRWLAHWTNRCNGATGKGVTVAVLDTGVDASHQEFKGGKITAGYVFDPATGSATPQTPIVDTGDHGTHVAGLICGDTVGTAPDSRVISAVMIPNGKGTVAGCVIAMAWAAMHQDVQIVHLSAGVPGYAPEMRDAVQAMRACGVLTVAAIGNDGRNITRSPGNFAGVLSVGSFGFVNGYPRLSPFSSTGNMVVDYHSYYVPRVIAPGESVRSAVPGNTYATKSGTSMAAPQVTGIAARMLERSPGISLVDLFAEIDEVQARWFVETGVVHPRMWPFHPELFHMLRHTMPIW